MSAPDPRFVITLTEATAPLVENAGGGDPVSDTAASDSAADSTARARDPWARMQAMARPPFGAITRPLDAGRFDGRHVFDMAYKNNDRGFVPGRREARRWRAA